MKNIIAKPIALFFLISLLLGLVACSPAEQAAEPLEVTLIASDIAYDATRIETKSGQPVELTFENTGVLEHDFSIAEISLSGEVTMTMPAGEMGEHDMGHMDDHPDLHVAAASGGHNTIVFTPSEPGEYQFYCTVSGHREAGMEGLLVVK